MEAKVQRNIETTKKLGIFLRKYTQFLFVTPQGRITFRDARQIQLTSYGPWRGEKPVRDDHSLLPCARGSHACLRGDDCAAEMFFSLFYLYFIFVEIRRFGLQNYIIISNCASFKRNFVHIFMFFSKKVVPLHLEKARNCSRSAK